MISLDIAHLPSLHDIPISLGPAGKIQALSLVLEGDSVIIGEVPRLSSQTSITLLISFHRIRTGTTYSVDLSLNSVTW
jgi:hypothetical protein